MRHTACVGIRGRRVNQTIEALANTQLPSSRTSRKRSKRTAQIYHTSRGNAGSTITRCASSRRRRLCRDPGSLKRKYSAQNDSETLRRSEWRWSALLSLVPSGSSIGPWIDREKHRAYLYPRRTTTYPRRRVGDDFRDLASSSSSESGRTCG